MLVCAVQYAVYARQSTPTVARAAYTQAMVTDPAVLSSMYPDLDADAALQDELAMAGDATGHVTVDEQGVITAFEA